MSTRAERAGFKVTECKTCGKRIFFAVDEHGKKQVLDASAPVFRKLPDGRVALAPTGFVSHFATCPQASLHSGGGPEKGR